MVVSIVVVCVLTCSALIHNVCDLKDAQMNIPRNRIQELMLNEFRLKHSTAEEFVGLKEYSY